MAPVMTWLGQSGFLLEAGGRRILIDPFFSEHDGRAYAPPPVAHYGARIDWLLVTHEHIDHLDAEALPRIAALSDGLTVVAPEPLEAQVHRAAPGVAFAGVRPGEQIELDDAGLVTVVPAIHAVAPEDGYSDGSARGGPPRFVGYVLELAGVALYHAGDTIVSDAVIEALEPLRVDVALLPINGRNYFRERDGLAGNLDFREAVVLAERIGARTLVPIHWDLFAANSERPGAAVDEAAATGAKLHVLTLRRGLPWVPTPAR